MRRELLNAATERLRGRSPSPRPDAEILLGHVLGLARSRLLARDDEPVAPGAAERFERLLARRAAGEPVAYLTGSKEFWSLELEVTPDVLVPRPETELLVEWALSFPRRRESNLAVLDIGTGSGAIALALAKEWPNAAVTATDISVAALDVARANAQRLEVSNVVFRAGALFAACHPEERSDEGSPDEIPRFARDDTFDVIVSNPPYVAENDPHLADLKFEPAIALTSGPDGLDALRAIVASAPSHLHPGGWLLVEHGAGQGASVRALFRGAGFRDVETRRDLAGLERATGGSLA